MGFEETISLPSKIFFKFILPKTGTLVTDYQQTQDGQRFWTNKIGKALQKSLFVNFQSDRVIKQVTSIRELDSLRTDIHRNHQKYRQKE